ncbi:sodium-coupled monocarboxylate transporter 1-like [Toxorhynchites rutilus septentrionalis]|uniref:sodium-coupled monocarboxylate transporter 1-like n=1 Tax=Toxorhynchites rutilus septentrionalis TaxID=329112 RepID=UPI00247A3AEE|nr:sodium-coupled monocarboxylate transporter 1-like [Toxorhynchites rutilus septentrionalis]
MMGTDSEREFTTVASIEHVLHQNLRFQPVDYVIFVVLLAISALIGVYFGFISKIKQNNVEEYLLGGKTMAKIPVAASLIATSVSGITLLGVPTEIYAYGTQIWVFMISAVIVGLVMHYIYLPVFHDMQLTSCFAYLELRFDRVVRLTASFVYMLSALFLVPVITYVPAIALSQVSGMDIQLTAPILCAVCVFYTTVGGLRAVVWTDTIQFLLMLAAIFAVVWLGIVDAGGFRETWNSAKRGGRLIFFNFNPDPTQRTSFWSMLFGMTSNWIAVFGINQACIQRFLAVPTRQAAKNSLKIYVIGLIVINSLACFLGLLMYAHYETCDPMATKQIEKLDQVVPFYVMNVGSKIPGLPGLFIAGVFSAALSTMSSTLNTLTGTIYEDFIRVHRPNATEKSSSTTMKIIVVVLGLVVLALVFVVEKMGSIVQMAVSCTGVISGSVMGMFTLGMMSPRCNTKGVVSGVIVSIGCMVTLWIAALGKLHYEFLPLRNDGCDGVADLSMSMSFTAHQNNSQAEEKLPFIFRISFMYYSLLGLLIFLAVAYPVSVLTGGNKVLDQRLLTPFARSRNECIVQMLKISGGGIKDDSPKDKF